MKTSIETAAKVFATAVWADNKFAETEREALKEIAEFHKIDAAELIKLVEAEAENLNKADEAAVNAALAAAAKDVDAEDKIAVFEGVQEIVLCDGTVTRSEVETILAISESLGIDALQAVTRLLYLIGGEEKTDAIADDDFAELVNTEDPEQSAKILKAAKAIADAEEFSIEL